MLATAGPAQAFNRQTRPFGAGLLLGDPFGITAKYYLTKNTAVQGAIGGFGWPSGVGLQADYLLEFRNVINTRGEAFEVPLFVGAGLKLGTARTCNWGWRRSCTYGPIAGLRVPFGAALQLKDTPLEFQLELAPVIYTGFGWLGLDGDAGLALRYYF